MTTPHTAEALDLARLLNDYKDPICAEISAVLRSQAAEIELMKVQAKAAQRDVTEVGFGNADVSRSGCTAGSDEECANRQCATRCPAEQAKAAMDVKLEAVGIVDSGENGGIGWTAQGDTLVDGQELVTLESAQQAVAAEREKADVLVHGLRNSNDHLQDRITELEAALRQCVDALNEALPFMHPAYKQNDAITNAQEFLK